MHNNQSSAARTSLVTTNSGSRLNTGSSRLGMLQAVGPADVAALAVPSAS